MEKANRCEILVIVTVIIVSLPQVKIRGNENSLTPFPQHHNRGNNRFFSYRKKNSRPEL